MVIFKIATYNVNSIRSRLHIVIPWLDANRPDVFCMQETKVEDKSFPLEAFADAGYHVTFRGSKSYNGVAIASLTKPEGIFFGLDNGSPKDEDRVVGGVFSGIHILNTYVPQGRDRESTFFSYKLQWFKRIRELLEKRFSKNDPVLWCGDLNVAPESIDVHDPKRLLGHVCFTPEVWDAYRSVTAWGVTDIFRKHHPGETGCYTFFDYRMPKSAQRNLGWRVDHILATSSFAERSLDCTIDMAPRLTEKPSDHTILFAEFKI